MAEHNILGEKGEQLAVNYLLKQGYTIIATNWRKHKYELDIVAQQNKELVIVEVKTRSTAYFGNPEEAVTSAKQKHLVKGANCYIETNEIDLNCRFDVISIILNATSEKITHFKDAFYPEAD